MEISEIQSKVMNTNQPSSTNETASVNKIGDRKQKLWKKAKKHEKSSACFRCGKTGHFGKDPSCPARNKTCHNGNMLDILKNVARQRTRQRERDMCKKFMSRLTYMMMMSLNIHST